MYCVPGTSCPRNFRGIGPFRERGRACQISGTQAVKGGSWRPFCGKFRFSRRVRCGSGLSSSGTVNPPVPRDCPMNANPSIHPSEQTLSSYGLGKLDDSSAEAVNEHLEQCPDCRKRVAEMSADSFLERVRGAQARPESLAAI